jgi:integrase
MARRGRGEGSVYFDHSVGLYAASVDRGVIDGKRLRKVVRAKTKAGVLAKLREMQHAVDNGLPLPDKQITTGAWLEHWLDNVLPGSGLAPRTIGDYRYNATKYVIPAVGNVPLVKLTPEHVEKMMTRLRDRGLTRTVSFCRAVLRMALGEAEKRARVARNVAALTKAPKKPATKLDDALDAAQAASVLQAASGDRLEALAVLVLMTGMRKGEAMRLRWPDIDLKAKTVTIRKAKSEAGVRTIALPPMVVTALREHRRQQNVERMAATYWDDVSVVFASTIGTPLDGRNVTRWWHDLTIRAGVGRRRFHAARHTAATLMLNNGVPLEVVSKTLGHAGLAITADVYAKVRPELQRSAADAMERVLG